MKIMRTFYSYTWNLAVGEILQIQIDVDMVFRSGKGLTGPTESTQALVKSWPMARELRRYPLCQLRNAD